MNKEIEGLFGDKFYIQEKQQNVKVKKKDGKVFYLSMTDIRFISDLLQMITKRDEINFRLEKYNKTYL